MGINTHSCHNFGGHGLVITSHSSVWMYLFIHELNHYFVHLDMQSYALRMGLQPVPFQRHRHQLTHIIVWRTATEPVNLSHTHPHDGTKSSLNEYDILGLTRLELYHFFQTLSNLTGIWEPLPHTSLHIRNLRSNLAASIFRQIGKLRSEQVASFCKWRIQMYF